MLLDTDTSPWLAVFGRFHLVLLHLPIGLLPGMFLLEFGAALFRRPIPRGALLSLAILTALTAIAAFFSGLVLGDTHRGDVTLLAQHKNFAIAMSSICVLLPILAALKSRRPFRLALVAGVALSIPTGHLGGTMVHNDNFLFKPLAAKKPEPPAPQPSNDEQPAVELSHFDREIMPIFKRVCVECHKEDDPDGDLVLTTKEGIQCLDRDEADRVIVPGKPDQSLMIELCELPLDDDDHMPPADEPQLTKEELASIRAWIADGAKY